MTSSVEKIVAELSSPVSEVMTKQVVAVLANESAEEVAEQMASGGVRHAVVVDGDKHVLGVVSQRDIFAHFMDTLNEPAAAPTTALSGRAPWEIGSLVRTPPITVGPDILVGRAGIVLANGKIDLLPVVDENNVLLGTLSVKEMLRQIVGRLNKELDEDFTFFTPEKKARPQLPAFFRRANGALVLPISCVDDPANPPGFVLLGYQPQANRIAVKFLADASEEGARKIVRDGDNLVIAASDFVARFDIKLNVSAWEITRHRNFNCVVLTPKQILPAAAAPPPPVMV